MYRVLRPEEETQPGLFAKCYTKYMSPGAHVRKTKDQSPTFSATFDWLLCAYLAKHSRHQRDPVVSVAEFAAETIVGYSAEATTLIPPNEVQPMNFAHAYSEALVYGFVQGADLL